MSSYYRSQALEDLLRPSLATRALDTILTPIGTAGRILDTPGSVLRGLIAGDPGRAFGGIFDAKQRVSGAELFGGRKNEFTWQGLGAEVVLDPLNLLSFNKATKAGQLLKRSKNLEAAIQAGRVVGADIPSVGTRLFRNATKLDEISNELTRMGKAGRRLGETLGDQARFGDISLLSLDIPFTDINVPLIKGAKVYDALGGAGKAIKAIPGADKVGHLLNTTFNTAYNPETRQKFSLLEQAIRSESDMIRRESATRAEQAVSNLYGIRDNLAKMHNLTPEQADHKLALAIEKGELGGIPNIGEFARPYSQITRDLLNEGRYEGLPDLQHVSGVAGYAPHYLTPEGAEFFKRASRQKKSDFTRYLRQNIPGFTLKRRLMPNEAIPDINALARKQYGIDFDIMSTDIIDNLGRRMVKQGEAIADRRLTEGYLKAFGITAKQKAAIPKVSKQALRGAYVNAPALFKKLADKSKGPTITTAFHAGDQIGTPFQYYEDKTGKLIPVTADDRNATIKFAKFERQLARDSKEIERVRTLLNPQTRPQAYKPLTPARELKLHEKLDEILQRYPADLVNNEPFDPFNTQKTLEEHLLGSKEWAHGTTQHNLEGILGTGYNAKKPAPQWGSTKAINGKKAMFFGPEDVARNFAGLAGSRYPGAVEHSEKTMNQFLLERFLEQNPHHKPAVEQAIRDDITERVRNFRNLAGSDRKTLKHVQKTALREAQREVAEVYGGLPNSVLLDFERFKRGPIGSAIVRKAYIRSSPRELMKLGLLHDEVTAHVDDWAQGVKTGTYLNETGDASQLQQLMAKGVSKDMLQRLSDTEAKLSYTTKRAWSYKDNILRWDKNESQKVINKMFDDADLPRFIPKKEANNLKHMLTEVNTPEFARKFVNTVDKINAIYRGALTVGFPAYHVRNALSGMFMNALNGILDPTEYIRSMAKLKGLSPERIQDLRGLGVLGKGLHEETRRIIEQAELHKLGTKGKAAEFVAKPAVYGYSKMQHLGQAVDNMNRYTLYEHYIKKGYTPTEAALEVKKFHFDYADLTTTEKQVLRRSILFYTFMRNNIPLMLKQVVENHRAVTLYNRMTGQTNANIEEPTWMLNSFFVGKDKSGNPLRLNLGLPLQDPDRFNTEGRGLHRFAQIFASMFSPVAVVPFEALSGQSLFYDKPIEGGLLERLAKASPLARLTGTGERFIAEPKTEALRFLTSINLQSPSVKDIRRENQVSAIKSKLKGLVKSGKARELSVYAKRGDNPPPELHELNSRLAKLLKQ